MDHLILPVPRNKEAFLQATTFSTTKPPWETPWQTGQPRDFFTLFIFFTAFFRGRGQSLGADWPNIKPSATTSAVLGLANPCNAPARWGYLWDNWLRSRYELCSPLGEMRGWGWWTVCIQVAVRDGGEVIRKQRHCGYCEVRMCNPLWILSHTFMPSN